MTTIDGKALAECFALVARCGSEIQGLRDTLANMLAEAIAADKNLPCVIAGNAEESDRLDDSGWVYTDIAYSLPLKGRGKGNKNAELYLGFQISMVGNGIAIPGNTEPLLHVFCWDCAIDFEDDYVGFPLDQDDEYPKCNGDCLLVWNDSDAEWKRSWIFSLRLVALNSPEDLKNQVVIPALNLLRKEEVNVIFPAERRSALIRYPELEKLTANQ